MEKSIENIWKEGFEAETKLSAPAIANFYDKKSKLITQKINKRTKKDNLSLLPVALIISAILVFMGEFFLAIYNAVLIVALFFANKKMLRDLNSINIQDNTYYYLLNYKKQVKKIIKSSTLIAGLGFPMVIIPAYWVFFQDTKVMIKLQEMDSILAMMLVAGLALFFSIVAISGYKLSNKMMYGNLLERLESTIEDMEELMKD
ncbi:hypothetical protein ACFQ3R_12720 [Mesonia ostreae]|uniref:Uncharacterized protein n=1 Tax=Mesonia ostreae TaxID=861110 RepID=A0ABU2KFG9_9FLAO|nr:hypothetical protein [Mesonia ostreae]MDT0293448.1 hypothetical protein [Mesonia ostreae]